MTIDIKHILSLAEEERDFEIWKLLYPETWQQMQDVYSKYHKNDEETAEDFAKQVGTKFDWNLAMKKRDECNVRDFYDALYNVFLEIRGTSGWDIWLACDTQPHHYILAAIVAGEVK